MGSEEEEAYKLARYLDANYVLIIFGGVSYYSGDDISKFLWMIRIAGKSPLFLSQSSSYSWCLPIDKGKQLLYERSLQSRLRGLLHYEELPYVQAGLL